MPQSTFRLSLPTDIPWQKVCVTDDMMDRVVCDTTLPPKWQSSVAMFKYVPDEEYQQFPDYDITYLKVTATITGYQPLDAEIQGEIDWDGVDITTIDGLTEMLNSYYPCSGAILQVVVGPQGREPDLALDQYPFFIDFEPKKRELYELATDTKEKQSRSFETLNLSKSAGTAQSLEVMDVDMGGSTGFGLQASYAGTGGGFNYSSSTQGQWGTKSLNTDQSQVMRTTESGTEKRESYSHTTQLSQMYHLLDSYHLGTNRAVFFIQPRPHVIEEPSGFVRGPRKVEGIQEFFLVVAQPKGQDEELCFSVRLDTSHLAETDILEYDRRTDVSDIATATARVATDNDTPDGTTTRRACFLWECWDITYTCYLTRDVDDQVYTAPDGYIIESYNNLVNESSSGSTSVSIAPGNKTLTVHAEANGHICYETSGICLDCDDEIEKWAGSARRQVQVNLRSEDPIVKVGTRQQLLITTRGLCCCPEDGVASVWEPKVIAVLDVPEIYGGTYYYPHRDPSGGISGSVDVTFGGSSSVAVAPQPDGSPTVTAASQPAGSPSLAAGPQSAGSPNLQPTYVYGSVQPALQMTSDGYYERRITIRQANAVTDFVRDRMITSPHDPRPGFEPKRFVETDFFARQIEAHVSRSRLGRRKISEKAAERVNNWVVRAVGENINKKPEDVTVRDVLRTRNHEFLRLIDMKAEEIARIKMDLLGVKIKDQDHPGVRAEWTVPNVVNASLEEARKMLRGVRLLVGDLSYLDNELPRGTVISQYPNEGSTVLAGSDVDLVVASGAIVQIPDVVGESIGQSLMMLRNAGLASEPDILFSPSAEQPKNHVLEVTPEVGVYVSPNAGVVLQVSSGAG